MNALVNGSETWYESSASCLEGSLNVSGQCHLVVKHL